MLEWVMGIIRRHKWGGQETPQQRGAKVALHLEVAGQEIDEAARETRALRKELETYKREDATKGAHGNGNAG